MISDINDIVNNIFPYLTSAEIQQKLIWVRIGFFSVSYIFLGFIIFAVFKTHYFKWMFVHDSVQFLTFRPFGAKRITKIWNKILKRLDSGLESEYKLALIEVDDMLDASLKKMGYLGQTLEEKLQKVTIATLPNIEDIGRAHAVRNKIVHEPDYRLTLDEAKKTLEIYEKAFNALQILT